MNSVIARAFAGCVERLRRHFARILAHSAKPPKDQVYRKIRAVIGKELNQPGRIAHAELFHSDAVAPGDPIVAQFMEEDQDAQDDDKKETTVIIRLPLAMAVRRLAGQGLYWAGCRLSDYTWRAAHPANERHK